MLMYRQLIDYLPPILQQIREFRTIMEAEQSEMETIWETVDRYLENAFITTQDEDTAARWEKLLGIAAKGTDSLEDRNNRILAKVQEALPYTHRVFERMLTAIVGSEENFKLIINNDEYKVEILIGLSAKAFCTEVEALAECVIPMNMLLTVGLMYNTHKKMEAFTHAELMAHTYVDLRESVL